MTGTDDSDGVKVSRQILRMANDEACRSYQRNLFSSIQARRRQGPAAVRTSARAAGPPRPVRVGTLEQSPGFLVAVEGEVLVRREVARQAAALLQPKEFRRAPVPAGLERRLVRFVSPRAVVPEAHELARELRADGVAASVNHVVPLGYVAKGEGGFEPTSVRPERSARRRRRSVKVAVIDTGIAAEPRGDGWLTDVVHGVDDVDPLYVPGREDEQELDFSAGHGHFVAGIVEQVCPEAQLLVYRAVESDGIGSELQIAHALLRAADAGAQVINLSLGTETADDAPPVGLQVALEALAESHPEVVVVAAAGNSGRCRPTWPAAFRSVVSVASVTAELRPSAWSSSGPTVDCSAVGEGVVSTYVCGAESVEVDKLEADTFGEDAWAVGTGTSFAAPQVSGRLARLLTSSPDLTPRQALTRLLGAGHRTVPGYGKVLQVLPGTSTA